MRTVVCVVAVALACACASAGKIEPTIHIRSVQVPEARTPLANQFSTVLEIEIMNPSTETLTVDRIQLGSVSLGTYTIDPVVERPQKTIAPGTTELFRVWAQMRVQQETPSDGLDPILIRGAVEFLASTGAFRRTFAKQVNPSTLR
jgi:hypothetical protein